MARYAAGVSAAPRPPFSKYWLTYLTICVSTIIEKGVEQVVPALFPQLKDALALSPSKLAIFPLVRALPQAVLGPLSAILVHYMNRKYASAIGCLLFGLCLVQYSLLNTLNDGYVTIFFAGVGLSIFLPSSYSLVADTISKEWQGVGFGGQWVVGATACGATSFIAIYVGGLVIKELTGWRFMNMIVGFFSIVMGLLNIAFVKDPRMELKNGTTLYWRGLVPDHGGLAQYGRALKGCMRWSFWILVLQGITAQIPFNVMIFWALFWDTMHMSSVRNGSIIFCFWICTGIGGLISGAVADALERKYGSKGRIFVAQFCGIAAVVTAIFIFLVVKQSNSAYVAYIVLCGVLGLFASATQSCLTMPVIGQIVLRKNRTAAYALDRCLENPIGAILAVFAGKLTERFGWKDTTLFPGPETDKENARSMAHAMLIFMGCCWAASVIIMSILYKTVPRDRAMKQEVEEDEDGPIYAPVNLKTNAAYGR